MEGRGMSIWLHRWLQAAANRRELNRHGQLGQGLTEYVVILALIVVAAIAVLAVMKTGLTNEFNKVINSLP